MSPLARIVIGLVGLVAAMAFLAVSLAHPDVGESLMAPVSACVAALGAYETVMVRRHCRHGHGHGPRRHGR